MVGTLDTRTALMHKLQIAQYLALPGVRHTGVFFIHVLRRLLGEDRFLYLVEKLTDQPLPYAKITTKSLLHYHNMLNTMHMVRGEFRFVKDLDVETIGKHLDKFVFYYGPHDRWAPQEHYENLKKQFPEGNYWFPFFSHLILRFPN